MSDNLKIPDGWKETTLGGVARLNYGKSLKTEERKKGLVPVYGSSGITGYNDEAMVNEKGYIIGRKGTVGAIYYSQAPFFPIDTVYYVTEKNLKVDFHFFFYLLKTLGLSKLNFDSAVPGLNREMAYSIEICFPIEKKEQKAIAEVLSSFDNKIELFREQNKTLEAIAQTIFNEWFVRFNFPDENGKPYKASGGKMIDSELGPIPEGWRVGKLGEFSSLKSGFAFKGEDFIDISNVKVIKIKDIVGKGSVDLQKLNFIRDSVINDERILHYKLFPGDIVLAMSGNTTGKIGVMPATDDNIFLNQRVGKFFLKEQSFRNFLYLFLMSGDYELKIANMGYGSAQPNINPSQIENISLFIPPVKLMTSFENTIKSIMQKSLTNISQIQTLSTLRDELLQKLMKGELRVCT